MSQNLVFMGTPEFAVPTLRFLNSSFNIVGVVTQPDRHSGRGRVIVPPPIKVLADQLELPTLQPQKLRDPEVMRQLEKWDPDAIIVAAYNQILRKEILDLPRYGCINVHASLLPRWRGAAPIQAAILHGDVITGITIMEMDAGLDTGRIISQERVPIHDVDTAESLSSRLAQVGAELVINTLPAYFSGEIHPRKQDNDTATYASMLKKQDGELDFHKTAVMLERQVRAFSPWPGTFTIWKGMNLKVLVASTISDRQTPGNRLIGRRLVIDKFPAIQTCDGFLVLNIIQLPGKKAISGDAFLLGSKDWAE